MVKFIKKTKNNVKFVDSEKLYESLINKKSLLYQIHDLVDFEQYRPTLEALYSDEGRSAHDCVFMFKICILQYLEGNLTERATTQRISTDLQYKHFLDMAIDDVVPHFTKLGTFRDRVGDNFSVLLTEFVQTLKDLHIITDDDVRYMDATHQIADVQRVSINTLLQLSCQDVHEKIDVHGKFVSNHKPDLKTKDFLLSESQRKKRFVELVEYAQELFDESNRIQKIITDDKLAGAHFLLAKIIKERSGVEGDKIVRENSEDKGKIASFSDKDARWGSKSKDYQFLGYKHNVTATKSGFIEVVSTHQGHIGDEAMYVDDAKKSTGEKIVADSKYGTLDNREKSEKLKIQLVSPCRRNMKAHLHHQVMEDAFQYNKTDQYKKEMKERGHVIEGIFGVMKRAHNFARAKVRGIKKVSMMAQISAFAMNLKALIKWDLARAT